MRAGSGPRADRMFAAIQTQAGGSNQWHHPLDQQTVIRMTRDTLYSAAIVNISADATITVPDAGHRYVSVMIVDQDHYINEVLHEPDKYLAMDKFATPYVLVSARMLVDAGDPGDIAAVSPVQDQFGILGPVRFG
jgi:hypothetical protein